MKHLKIYFIFLALPCLALQCDNDDDDIGNGKDDKAKVIKMSDEFLSYFCFPEGSYWIYEEASSGEMDSVYIKWRNRRVYEPRYNGTDDYKVENFAIHEIIRDSIYYGNASPLLIKKDRIQYRFILKKELNNQTVGWTVLTKFSDLSYAKSDTLDSNFKIDSLHKYYIKQDTFRRVLKINYKNKYLGIPFKRIWYAKDIGVIRRDFWDGTSWRLVRYHHAN